MCACDAYDETLETCLDLLPELIEPTLAGTFGETVTIEAGRWHHHMWRTWSAGHGSGTGLIDDKEAAALLETHARRRSHLAALGPTKPPGLT